MRPPFETFKRAICRGSYMLGSACGRCEKCQWERRQISASDAPDRLSFALYNRKAKPIDFIGGSDAAILKDAAERIARAEDALVTLAQQHAQSGVEVAALTAERDALKAEVARLSAPLTDDEALMYLDEDRYDMRATVDAVVAARATPPQDVENGGKG